MKKLKYIISALLVGGTLLSASAVFAGDVVVIVNRSNPERITPEMLKDIYSDQQITWKSGQKIEVYNLPENESDRETFARQVLGMSGRDMTSEENRRRVNNTLRNPTKSRREKLVASIVSKKRWAIGYVPKHIAEKKSGIRIVMTLKGN